jgi:hypothetical protein
MECLVVIAIVVVAIGLLLPAVQRVREAANLTACRNSLKQIALAAHTYEQRYTVLPPGMNGQHVGPLVYLLPDLQQEPQFGRFSFKPNQFKFYWEDPENLPADPDATRPLAPMLPSDLYGCQGEPKTFRCPSAPDDKVTGLLTVSYGRPGVDFTPPGPQGHLFARDPAREVLGTSNYLAVAGDWRFDGKYKGLFGYKSRRRLANVPDGTSNTLLFGEYAGGFIDWKNGPNAGGRPSGWSTGSWSSGALYLSFGLCPNPNNKNCADSAQGEGISWKTFGSLHALHIVQFAFADGSVRSITPTISFVTLLRLGGYNDREEVCWEDPENPDFVPHENPWAN